MNVETEPRWQRLEPDARRQQILACAIELFGERPFAAVSTTEIASAAKVARGLINHYFGNKRGLYLEVIRMMVTVPPPDQLAVPAGTFPERAAVFLDWFLNTVERHGRTWLVAVAGEGLAADPDVQKILRDADNLAADWLIEVLGLSSVNAGTLRASIRAYGGLIKSASREWIVEQTLTREQVHGLLVRALVAIVD